MIEEDQFGLLVIKPTQPVPTAESRLVASFQEIIDFVAEHGREPDPSSRTVSERQLGMRLVAMAGNPEQREALATVDTLGLLREPEPPASLEEALAHDPAGLLNGGTVDQSILNVSNLPRTVSTPDTIARREPCEDFEEFEPLFVECHAELRAGTRDQLPFRFPKDIAVGKFFVLGGLLLYVAEEGERTLDDGGRTRSRLRVIFDNGTQSNLLLQSLAANLYKGDGRRVTEPHAKTLEKMGLAPDTPMGSVYVLRSLADDDQVAEIHDLHKIGSTSRRASERIADAAQQATFLNAPVELRAEYRLPAVAAPVVEQMLHQFFSSARLDVWFERDGVTVAEANEWFDVPLAVIDEAVDLIQEETIIDYEYDRESRKIVLRR